MYFWGGTHRSMWKNELMLRPTTYVIAVPHDLPSGCMNAAADGHRSSRSHGSLAADSVFDLEFVQSGGVQTCIAGIGMAIAPPAPKKVEVSNEIPRV